MMSTDRPQANSGRQRYLVMTGAVVQGWRRTRKAKPKTIYLEIIYQDGAWRRWSVNDIAKRRPLIVGKRGSWGTWY